MIRNGFWGWLASEAPEILCLQETRIQAGQLEEMMRHPPGYHAFWYSAERKGYSGVAILSQDEPQAVQAGLGQPYFDVEGRTLVTEYPGLTLVNAYFPSGQRGQDRVSYKLEFYDALLRYCTRLREEGHRLVVCGDYNTAHQPIDLARPRENVKNSGFLPEEREAFSRWLDQGFVDVFRHLHPLAEEYTWWTYRSGARSRDIGWRIDYFLVVEELLPLVQGARILGNVTGSDHCPVELCLRL